MLVRLAFAVQVQVDPDILIVDEALAVGDWLFQKRCFQRIEKLISDGTTLLFVSHDQESVRTLTHNALLMSHGGSKAWGTSSEVVLEYRRLLHAEEAAYFRSNAEAAVAQAESNKQDLPINVEDSNSQGRVKPDVAIREARSNHLSFGEGEVEIEGVEVLDRNGEQCTFYHPGDEIRIRITCRARVGIEKLNVGVRLRNKEGVKVYSWGTLNQDMEYLNSGSLHPLFWRKKVSQGDIFQVELSCPCNLGTNLYEIQASISYEETPDYLSQRILRWQDEAAFFQVLVEREKHFFGGVVDLLMKAEWSLNESVQ